MTRKIAVIGMGYVGIPAAALFADVDGFEVIGIQRRSKRSGWKIEYLNEGKCPIGGDEPGLPELIHRTVIEKKTFHVTDDISIIRMVDTVLIDVQTPTDENHQPKYLSLREVSMSVGKYMQPGTLVVIESTVAPGTTENIVQPILEQESGLKAGKDFYLAFAYERVMVGRLIHNIVNYPRIIGGINNESTQRAVNLYRHITNEKLYPTTALTAEVAKVTENTYRDINVAFANEVALICESLGVNVYEVRSLVNTLPFRSNAYRDMHIPGAGVGGHCLPKDPWLLKYGVDTYGEIPVELRMIPSARWVNSYMPQHMMELIIQGLKEAKIPIQGAKICLLGLAFLENSDDTRNTPTDPLYRALKTKGLQPVIHDHLVREYELPFKKSLEEALQGASAVALITKHKEYYELSPKFLAQYLKHKIIVDGRDVYKRKEFEQAGFVFKAVGK
ncbi:MAG: nucleotide sugar dehydrogenase [Candidatus Hermodarchaeota archaeon]